MKLKLKGLKLILLFIATACICSAHAQPPSCNANVLPSTWTTLASKNGVAVSFKSSSCEGQSLLYLKMENANNHSVTVTWSLYGEKPQTTNLEPTQTKLGECSSNAPADMIVYLPAGADINNAVITVN